MDDGTWHRGKGRRRVANKGKMRKLSNSPVGLENQLPWSDDPCANPGEPGHGKSGKCPELRDSREVSAGVGVDPEVPGSMA